ncbi:hypothetical protein [Morganella morganii]|uniref:hypothetical protein n=1 Tax=Morganella morganii TaxID=582 RepID=UPI0033061317
MTGEVNEKYLTPQERKARQMVKAVNEEKKKLLPISFSSIRIFSSSAIFNLPLTIASIMELP